MADKKNHKPSLAERAAASRQALADALDNETRLEAEYTDAQAAVKAVNAAWERGDESIPESALLEAQARETRFAKLLANARQAVKVARRRIVNDVPDLAEAVATALGGEINGIPIVAVCEAPVNTEPLPLLRAIQSAPSTRNTIDGTIDGTVEIVLYGQRFVTALDPDDIGRRLQGTGVVLRREPLGHSEAGEVCKHVVALDILSAWEPVPVIVGVPQSWRIGQVASSLAHQVTTQMQSYFAPTLGIRVGGAGSDIARTVAATAGDSTLVSSTVVAGERRTVVRASASAYSTDGRYNGDDIARTMSQVVTGSQGRCVGGLGRVESAKVITFEPTGAYNRGRHVVAEFVFLSRQG